MPIGTDAHEHEIEDRPAVRLVQAGRSQLGLDLLGGPVGGQVLPDRLAGRERVDVLGWDPEVRAAVVLVGQVPGPASSMMSSNGPAFESGWSAGTKRSSPHHVCTLSHGHAVAAEAMRAR